MAYGHIGSWGLPDFGITEGISDWLGYGRTDEGGSMLRTPATAPSNLAEQQNLASQQVWQQSLPTYTSPTNTTTTTNTTPTSGDSTDPYAGFDMSKYPGWDENAAKADWMATGGPGGGQGGFADYLDQQYNAQEGYIGDVERGLDPQRASMEQQAQNTYQQGVNTLDTTYGANKGDLESYQTKTLQDIGEALKNMWQQGGRMLGTRGAADSSAAGMFNYAVGKLGSRQRGDVMQDVSRRLGNLKNYYDTNKQNLELEKNNKIQEIGQWYNEAVNQVRGMRAELQQQKSQQALEMAIQMLNETRSQAANKQSILDQWAANKAQSLPQLQQMLASNAQGLQPYQGLGANAQFSGVAQGQNMFGFGNQGQDTLNWLQNLIPTR